MNDSSWSWAVDLTIRFLKKPARLSHLLERLPASLDPGRRRRCQFLLFGVVRNWSFLEANLDGLLRRRPRIGMRAALLVTSYEIMAEPDKSAQIVDHAVGRIAKKFSSAEKAMANAVLRKVVSRIAEETASVPEDIDSLAVRYSHPKWLIERWVGQFGFQDATRMAIWNQEEPEVYFLPLDVAKAEGIGELSEWVPYRKGSDTNWTELAKGLEEGSIYIQNPGARLAPNLIIKNFQGGRILDLCAAPGGKSFYLDRAIGESIQEIVSVDLPGPRFERLIANIERFGSERIRGLARDLFKLEVRQLGTFDAVLLDAPCSNSGVLQKKPDAKWRLSSDRIKELIRLQLDMLIKASDFVAVEGLLVYSTCSVDSEENEQVVARFLKTASGSGFTRMESVVSLPWVTGHDGAGACILRRKP